MTCYALWMNQFSPSVLCHPHSLHSSGTYDPHSTHLLETDASNPACNLPAEFPFQKTNIVFHKLNTYGVIPVVASNFLWLNLNPAYLPAVSSSQKTNANPAYNSTYVSGSGFSLRKPNSNPTCALWSGFSLLETTLNPAWAIQEGSTYGSLLCPYPACSLQVVFHTISIPYGFFHIYASHSPDLHDDLFCEFITFMAFCCFPVSKSIL